MSLVFLAPGWLWLACLAPVVWFVPLRARDPLQATLRSLVVLLVAIGLARPAWWRDDEREHAVFVLDLSASVDAGDRARALEALASARAALPSRVRSACIVWGDTRSADGRDDARVAGFDDVTRLAADAGGSPLSAALEEATRRVPSGARGSVTWITDGLATDAHFGDALVELQRRSIPIHTVSTRSAVVPATPVRFESLGELRAGIAGRVGVDVAGDARDATVILGGPDGEIERREHVDVAGLAHVEFEYEPPVVDFVTLEAVVVDGASSRASRRTFAVQSPLRVLYFGSRVQGAVSEFGRLVGRGFVLNAPAPGDGWNAMAGAVAAHDLVVLDDVPAATLPDDVQRAIVEAVEERGQGLFVCGGESSFGPGGYADSAVARVLPVECVQKEEKRDPSTTLALIIDTSGSMGGERIQLAKEVARLAMARLLPHDKVGIVEFYGAKRWAAPIQPASNSIELQRAINRMDAGGGTIILPAIEEAFYGLQNVQTRYKHVLVLTDGGVENGAFEPLLRRMAEEGITVSTVLIGPEAHSEFLVDIANWGKGRFYSAPDRFNLPEILLKQPTSSRLPAYKPGEFPLTTRGGPAWWGRVDRASVPPIGGFVETAPRAGAETLLEIAAEHDPLLATWGAGLGRVTTFATEPVGPGTSTWRSWTDYGRFLARVLARTANEDRAGFAFTIERRRQFVEIVATRTAPGEARPVLTRVDGGTPRPIEFVEHAPGEFRGRTSVDPDVEARFTCRSSVPDAPEVRLVSKAHEDVAPETGVDPRTRVDSAAVARATGGDTVTLADLGRFVPRAGGDPRPVRLLELAPWFYASALLLWLAEILHRRRDRRRTT